MKISGLVDERIYHCSSWSHVKGSSTLIYTVWQWPPGQSPCSGRSALSSAELTTAQVIFHPSSKQSEERGSGAGFGKLRQIFCCREWWGIVTVVVVCFRRRGGSANILMERILETRHSEILYSPNNFPSSFYVLFYVFNWRYNKYPGGFKMGVGRKTNGIEWDANKPLCS